MKKVLYIIGSFGIGGAEKIVLDDLKILSQNKDLNIELLVLKGKTNSYYEKELESIENLKVTFTENKPKKSKILLIRKLITMLFNKKLIENKVKEFKPNIIHTHYTIILKLIPKSIINDKKIIKYHTLHSDPYAISKIDTKYAKKYFIKNKIIPICLNDEQIEKAKQRYKIDKYEVVKNGIDFEKFKCLDSNELIKKSLGISNNTFVVGFVGRLHLVKNLPFLIDKFSKFIKKRPDSVLLIVGDGGEKQNLLDLAVKKGINDRVKFLGNRADMNRIYRAFDLFMLCSTFESNSLVTVEAQLCNVRCLVSTAIPASVIITNKVKRLSLTDSDEIWINEMLNDGFIGEVVTDKSEYSLEKSCKKLEEIYLSE